MSKQWQTGFTLVELMVAMAIGTVIILGAGQLFLTTFQTFQKVDELSRKQETLVFAASSIIERVRNSDNGNSSDSGDSGYSLSCEEVPVGNSQRCDCTIYDNYENGQPILTFEKHINADEGLVAGCSGENTSGDISEPSGFNDYLYTIKMPVEINGKSIKFNVAARGKVRAEYFGSDHEDNGNNGNNGDGDANCPGNSGNAPPAGDGCPGNSGNSNAGGLGNPNN